MYLKEEIKQAVIILPEAPGVYRFYNSEGLIIYIGKAKNLKKRVSSYFAHMHDNPKTNILVRKINSLDHIVVDREEDALLLENVLIKKHKPRYNVLLKDDKTYPWICVKNEPFSRVFYTRKYIKDGSKYFGPFTSAVKVRELIKLFKRIFYLRNCTLNLETENLAKKKYKVCLEYHIGNCKGPCVLKFADSEYQIQIRQIEAILKGKFNEVLQGFREQMQYEASLMNFENAQKIKEKIDLIEDFKVKSTVVTQLKGNIDVFSLIKEEDNSYVNYLKTVDGAVVQIVNYELKNKTEESKKDLLASAIIDIYENKLLGVQNINEILLPYPVDYNLPYAKTSIPKQGDKLKLLELSQKNLKYFVLETRKKSSLIDPDRHKNRILKQMQIDLRLESLPVHIECFDNSNIQGTNPVASCVVFKNTKPDKKEYRHFNIKSVTGANDFASMEEIVYRRYKRLLDEQRSLPQLIIVDGGKGQLSSAVSSLDKLGLRGKIAIIGIAKKLEEIFFPDDNIPIYLNKNSETLKIIQQARDEAHRFGITFHRQKRSSNFIHSELNNIPGIGKKTIEQILKKMKNINNISQASLEELEKIIDRNRAEKIYRFFRNSGTDDIKTDTSKNSI